jgi:cell division protein FtsW (lipid II flippase)
MQTLLVLHNLVRWLILLFGFWTLISAISGLSAKRPYTSGDGKANFFFMLSMDIQLLIGLILYFSGVWFERLKHLGENMKDPMLRFFTMEHGLLMIIAWILVHAGRISVKKAATPQSKFKKTLIYFGIALLLILIAIPWPFREAVARPWVRWFS